MGDAKIQGYFWSVTALVLCATAQGQTLPTGDNVLPVNFTAPNMNQPMVTIKVCVPGTNNCKKISKVVLDSGSDGLRLFSSVLGVAVPHVQDKTGNEIAACGSFGSGQSAWGPVSTGDVILGNDRAANVPIQVLDSTYASVPSGCTNVMTGPSSLGGINGILGIGMGLPKPGALPSSNGYYSCQGEKCDFCSSVVGNWDSCGKDFPSSPDDMNPIAFVKTDNNGWILELPTPAATGSTTLSGTLTLGLATRPNNAIPSDVRTFPIDSSGMIPVQFQGEIYNAVLDTGATAWVFPAALQDVPACSGGNADLYCPPSPLSLQATLMSSKSSPKTEAVIDFQLVGISSLHSTVAFNNLGILPLKGPVGQNVFIMGPPFFMGRTVYYGLKGAQTPLGRGPFNAF
jgi:hypothetical protein